MALAAQNLETPNSRTILRSSLMHAVIEAMDKRFREPLATRASEPREVAPAHNRHDRRKAAALGRRGQR
jgi:hypothetical protein